MQQNNKTENIVSEINSSIFFKEFTFSKNDFKHLDEKQKLEFADNVVWLDNIFFVYQIKDRNPNEMYSDNKWFDSKILRKAVQQIKKTHKYLETYPNIEIINEKGHKRNVAEAAKASVNSLIIYTPTDSLAEEKKNLKFYESKDIGLIHLFHSEDYYWLCKFLSTPSEVKEYLDFREKLYIAQKKYVVHLPEQYVLAHFFETLNVDHLNPAYIENLKNFEKQNADFDISFLIENFNNKIKLLKEPTEYYYIIAEIAKLNRAELHEFKKRFVLMLEKCKLNDMITPYRIYIPRTDCAFVFIPMHASKSEHWKNALTNYIFAQKYDQRASKCLGVVVFEKEIEKETYFDMYWNYVDFEWVYDARIETLLKDNFPFRKVSTKKVDNRYK